VGGGAPLPPPPPPPPPPPLLPDQEGTVSLLFTAICVIDR
jgi:hypothetical protein